MDNFDLILAQIKNMSGNIMVLTGEPMRNHTSFRIGGVVPAMFIPKNSAELSVLCLLFRDYGVKPLIIGNGTNLLVEDGVLDFPVIKTAGVTIPPRLTGDCEIAADSGTPLSRLAVFALANSLSGLEFAHGIPGTLGGAVSMNAGAYGGEMRNVVVSTRAYGDSEGEFTLTGEEHGFSYRHSAFSDTGKVILSSVLKLSHGDASEIKARMDDLSERRKKSQPLDMPSAGSTFKRPTGGYAAAMIEGSGLKGYTIGGARVSEKHAGFVVNAGSASFEDVRKLVEHIQKTVENRYGVTLEPEIKIIRRGWGRN